MEKLRQIGKYFNEVKRVFTSELLPTQEELMKNFPHTYQHGLRQDDLAVETRSELVHSGGAFDVVIGYSYPVVSCKECKAEGRFRMVE